MTSSVWVVTGISSGFGQELAKVIASKGDRVIATSRSPQRNAKLAEGSPNITVKKLDQNQSFEEIKADFAKILKVHGTVDIIVNCAAYVETGFLEESSPANVEKQFVSNVFGPLNVYRAALPHLRQKKAGKLITFGSMAAWYPMNGCNLYNASKAAIRWIGIGLAEEVKHLDIQHCLIEPGFFRTALLDQSRDFRKTEASSRIADYKELNETNDSNFESFHGAQLGDPTAGAEIIYEVVTSTGRAAGRPFPGFLPLGSDAVAEISKAAQQTLDDVESWRAIAIQSDYKE